jgi:KaiC/GvpD/RAD55 family RecA-like ATPase
MERVQTGSRILDTALAGGIPSGSSLLVSGEEGAGATEFALTVLRTAARDAPHRKARFASALRSAARVAGELEALFEGAKEVELIDVRVLAPMESAAHLGNVLDGLGGGDVLVIESADALAGGHDAQRLIPFWHSLADAAQERGVVVILLHAPGTLPLGVEAAIAEGADGVLRFTWHDGGPTRRRLLSIPKLRGLAPVLDGEQVPVFEVALQRGLGFSISRETSVL